jgi:hypothetical protein
LVDRFTIAGMMSGAAFGFFRGAPLGAVGLGNVERTSTTMATELTDRLARTEQANPPTQPMRLLWDDQVRGFCLRITRAGAAAWVLT